MHSEFFSPVSDALSADHMSSNESNKVRLKYALYAVNGIVESSENT